MILKKDNFAFGFILGLIAPLVGLLIFKYRQLNVFSYKEALQYMMYQPGHSLLTVGLSVSLLINAVLFTIFINTHIDKTAKGIFVATIIYGLIVLILKTIG